MVALGVHEKPRLNVPDEEAVKVMFGFVDCSTCARSSLVAVATLFAFVYPKDGAYRPCLNLAPR